MMWRTESRLFSWQVTVAGHIRGDAGRWVGRRPCNECPEMNMFLMSTGYERRKRGRNPEAEGEITLLGNIRDHNAESASSWDVYQRSRLNNLDSYSGADVLVTGVKRDQVSHDHDNSGRDNRQNGGETAGTNRKNKNHGKLPEVRAELWQTPFHLLCI